MTFHLMTLPSDGVIWKSRTACPDMISVVEMELKTQILSKRIFNSSSFKFYMPKHWEIKLFYQKDQQKVLIYIVDINIMNTLI